MPTAYLAVVVARRSTVDGRRSTSLGWSNIVKFKNLAHSTPKRTTKPPRYKTKIAQFWMVRVNTHFSPTKGEVPAGRRGGRTKENSKFPHHNTQTYHKTTTLHDTKRTILNFEFWILNLLCTFAANSVAESLMRTQESVIFPTLTF